VLGDPVNLVDPEGLMTKKVKPDIAEEIIKETYCKLKREQNLYGCTLAFNIIQPLALTPDSQKLNVEYRIRCQSTCIDLLHCDK
jgi:hypothetical protein